MCQIRDEECTWLCVRLATKFRARPERRFPEGPTTSANGNVWSPGSAAGDEALLASLYDSTNPIVYGLALSILGDPASAEDVTMEVYLQVWRTAGGSRIRSSARATTAGPIPARSTGKPSVTLDVCF